MFFMLSLFLNRWFAFLPFFKLLRSNNQQLLTTSGIPIKCYPISYKNEIATCCGEINWFKLSEYQLEMPSFWLIWATFFIGRVIFIHFVVGEAKTKDKIICLLPKYIKETERNNIYFSIFWDMHDTIINLEWTVRCKKGMLWGMGRCVMLTSTMPTILHKSSYVIQ